MLRAFVPPSLRNARLGMSSEGVRRRRATPRFYNAAKQNCFRGRGPKRASDTAHFSLLFFRQTKSGARGVNGDDELAGWTDERTRATPESIDTGEVIII